MIKILVTAINIFYAITPELKISSNGGRRRHIVRAMQQPEDTQTLLVCVVTGSSRT